MVREKLNEEATRYLREFPGEMIFHTSNLHLLNMIGQGNKMCACFFFSSSWAIYTEICNSTY